jgi:hypothetical protein
MAKIHEEVVLIKLSKLIKDSADSEKLVTDDITSALQTVAEELAAPGVVVEIEQA